VASGLIAGTAPVSPVDQARTLRFSAVFSIWFITRTAASGILVPAPATNTTLPLHPAFVYAQKFNWTGPKVKHPAAGARKIVENKNFFCQTTKN